MTLNKKKIGIFGGTFNPVHYGHLLIAENACDQFELDHVIFLPTGHTPHKAFMGEKMSIHRCHMVEAAIADNPKFSISYREIESTGVNYTYVTLARFHNDYPDCELYFILGADSLFDFDSWRHPEEICKYANILAAVRGNLNAGEVDRQIVYLKEKYHSGFYRLNTPNFSVSSRELRERIMRGTTIRYMLPPQAEQYIRDHALYREDFA